MLSLRTPAYRYAKRSRRNEAAIFHLDPDCPGIQRASTIRKGTLGGCLAAGRRLCKLEAVDQALLPPVPVLAPLPVGAA